MSQVWAVVLAVLLGVALVVLAPASSRADDVMGLTRGGTTGAGTGVPLPPSGSGDPDSPSNTGKSGWTGGVSTSGMSISAVSAPAVPSRPQVNSSWWMLRLKLGLLALKSFYLRD